MEIRTKHVRAGFKAGFEPGLEGLKAMEIGAKQYNKEGSLFWTSKPEKKAGAQKLASPVMLDPILGSIFGPKNGVSHRRISLLPADVVQADLRLCSLNRCVNLHLLFLYPKSRCYCQDPFIAAVV